MKHPVDFRNISDEKLARLCKLVGIRIVDDPPKPPTPQGDREAHSHAERGKTR